MRWLAMTVFVLAQAPEALLDVLDMEPAEAARMERMLARNPEDLPTRLRLMAYWGRADRDAVVGDRAKRWKSAMWMVEHHPGREHVFTSVGYFASNSVTKAQIEEARGLWTAAMAREPKSAAIRWNAAVFFMGLDADLQLRFLEETAELDPNHPQALRPLAYRYGDALLKEGSALAGRVEEKLERSKNVWVLGNVANYLQLHLNQGGVASARIAKLAERYFLMAQKLDPKLKREVILPVAAAKSAAVKQVDLVARFDGAAKEIRRLWVSDFPKLPDVVAGALRGRGCRVPQPSPEAGGSGKAANVIRGEFVEKGVAGWAVLCSVRGSSTLLVFRNDGDAKPYELGVSEDRGYLQQLGGDAIGYSREIRSVGQATILRHYRAYGGPKPPPIEHEGIDDAFLGKASVVWYCHRGKWMTLQGAD